MGNYFLSFPLESLVCNPYPCIGRSEWLWLCGSIQNAAKYDRCSRHLFCAQFCILWKSKIVLALRRYATIISNIYRPQRSWGKVIFSECVKNSVHRGGMCGGGACMAAGVHGRWGVCVAGSMHGRGCMVGGICGGGMHGWGGVVGVGACMACGQWASSTHPTGMHSCWNLEMLCIFYCSLHRQAVDTV